MESSSETGQNMECKNESSTVMNDECVDPVRESGIRRYNALDIGTGSSDPRKTARQQTNKEAPMIKEDESGGYDGTFTVQEAIDSMGCGCYQIRMIFLFGMAAIAEFMELMLISVLSPILKCVFYLDELQQSLLSIVIFLGSLLSGGFWGKLGDKYGRKTAVMMSCAWYGYYGLLSALSPGYTWMVTNRLLVAVGIGGFPQVLTLYSEFLPTKSRSTWMMILGFGFSLGACSEVLLAIVSLATLDWRWFLVLTAVPVNLFVCLYKIIPESPRYLLTHGKYHEALAILENIAKTNGKELPPGRLCQPCDKTMDKNRFLDLFTPKFLRTTLLLGLAIAAVNMAYFGTVLLTTSLFDLDDGCHGFNPDVQSRASDQCRSLCRTLSTDDYKDMFITSLGDVPGVVVCMVLMFKLGRKTSLYILMGCYTALMLAANLCAPRLVLVVLLFGARAIVSGAAHGAAIYVTEVYPTSIRSIGMGWFVIVRSIGACVAVLFVNLLVSYSVFLGISSFAAVGFVAALCFFLLPYETRNKNTADCIEEVNS